MSKPQYLSDFNGKKATAQIVETARGEWKAHTTHVWGGTGKAVHAAASWVQTAAGAFMIGSSPTLAIPLVGEALEGSEAVVYGFAAAVKGLVRTSAENHAIDQAGGTKADHASVGRTVVNIIKEAVPFFDIK